MIFNNNVQWVSQIYNTPRLRCVVVVVVVCRVFCRLFCPFNSVWNRFVSNGFTCCVGVSGWFDVIDWCHIWLRFSDLIWNQLFDLISNQLPWIWSDLKSITDLRCVFLIWNQLSWISSADMYYINYLFNKTFINYGFIFCLWIFGCATPQTLFIWFKCTY